MNPCPPHDRLALLLNDQLPDSDFPEIEAHIEACTACQAVLERLREDDRPIGLAAAVEGSLRTAGHPATRLAGVHRPPGSLRHPDEARQRGHGAVYQAYDSRLRRPVALKIVNPELAALPGFRGLFDREAHSAAGIASDYVVRILHVTAVTGEYPLPFLVMELIEGESLKDRLTRRGFLAPAEAAGIALHVALGLAATHGKGLVHRDIKPSNIMLDRATRRAG